MLSCFWLCLLTAVGVPSCRRGDPSLDDSQMEFAVDERAASYEYCNTDRGITRPFVGTSVCVVVVLRVSVIL